MAKIYDFKKYKKLDVKKHDSLEIINKFKSAGIEWKSFELVADKFLFVQDAIDFGLSLKKEN